MKAPVSWIRECVNLPENVTTEQLADRLTELGLKLEAIQSGSAGIEGPLVIGRVLTRTPEPQSNGKTINWCTVDVGEANGTGEPQGIVCGAHNFEAGDLVVVILPGGVLPGNFQISARKTYGHISAGMICSARELGIGEDHDGIIVLPPDAGQPGEPAFAALGMDDEVIEFEINPDRAYALSLRGLAREAALGFGVPFIDPAVREVPGPNAQGYPVFLDDLDGCPRFAARMVTGFNPSAPTPEWMARRLQQCGMRSISLAVDVTNYVMLELGQPIHGYDAAKLQGHLRVRRALPGERLVTLDEADRELDPADLVVVDDTGPIGLGGVMGGASTEISDTTTTVLIEAAHWNPVDMFRTGKRHKLQSEAGKRNERGVDPELPSVASYRVAELLTQLGGGVIELGCTVAGVDTPPRSITLAAELPARVTGMEISADTTIANLKAVGCVLDTEAGQLKATVPTWRPDLNDPYDLVEEVARVVGYETVPSVVPSAPGGRGWTLSQRLRRRAAIALAAEGFNETISFPWIGASELDKLGLAADDPRRSMLRLANPLSSEEPHLTTTVLPGLFKNAARNVGLGQSDLALFEVATVTQPTATHPAPIYGVSERPSEGEYDALLKSLPDQPWHVGVVLTGEIEEPGWWGGGRASSWSDAIAAVQAVADALDVAVSMRAASVAPWHPGRCAEFVVGDVVVGHAGELHPKVCVAYGLPARSAAAEFDLDALIERAGSVIRPPEVSSYPVAKEDVAVVVDRSVPAAAVESALREGAGELLESIKLFDVFTGDQIGADQKSLAYALRFRAADRTLAEGEAAAAREAAVRRAAELVGAVQRT